TAPARSALLKSAPARSQLMNFAPASFACERSARARLHSANAEPVRSNRERSPPAMAACWKRRPGAARRFMASAALKSSPLGPVCGGAARPSSRPLRRDWVRASDTRGLLQEGHSQVCLRERGVFVDGLEDRCFVHV